MSLLFHTSQEVKAIAVLTEERELDTCKSQRWWADSGEGWGTELEWRPWLLPWTPQFPEVSLRPFPPVSAQGRPCFPGRQRTKARMSKSLQIGRVTRSAVCPTVAATSLANCFSSSDFCWRMTTLFLSNAANSSSTSLFLPRAYTLEAPMASDRATVELPRPPVALYVVKFSLGNTFQNLEEEEEEDSHPVTMTICPGVSLPLRSPP